MIALPEPFENRMKSMLGPQFPAFREALGNPAPNSVRLNPRKSFPTEGLEPVSHCPAGYYLPARPVFTLDPLFHAGAYYVQESSSMILEQVIRQLPSTPGRVLDLCAAPGGKSTHLASLLPWSTLLVSNEVIRTRSQILTENLVKWGNPNVAVTCNDPRDFAKLPGFFDFILVDAPCSGEGLFRKDEAATVEWSEANATLCAMRQRRILADVWPALSDGGILMYSTCTWNPAENEENLEWLGQYADIEAVRINIREEWGIETSLTGGIPGYRFYPHKTRGEGFFFTVVRKTGTNRISQPVRSKSGLSVAGRQDRVQLLPCLDHPGLELILHENAFLAWPQELIPALESIRSNLYLRHAGIRVGELIKGSLLPSHELAMFPSLNRKMYPEASLNLEQAISFLKKEDFQADLRETGWNLVTYAGVPLGWMKNIGNRFNNNYPAEWRIRMSVAEYRGEKLALEARKFPFYPEDSSRQ